MGTRNLLEISKVASVFIRELAESEHYSYSQLAGEIGLTRNVLFYFASSSDTDKDQSVNIKLNSFSKILNWLENTDIVSLAPEVKQKKLAKHVKAAIGEYNPSMVKNSGQFEPLLEGFQLDRSEISEVLSQLPTMLIGIRQRGTTSDFQISIHRFQKVIQKNAVAWDMTFLQGRDPFDGAEIPRHKQVGVSVAGFAIPMENTLTCVGRLLNQESVDHNLSMMNIILKKPLELDDNKKLYQGSFYGYSRNEAISRHMLFVSTDHQSSLPAAVLSGHMGDVSKADLKKIYPEAFELFDGVLGFSVGLGGKQLNYMKGG